MAFFMRWTDDFRANVLWRLDENTAKVAACVNQLSESALWHRPNETTLSIGTTLVHLAGNITQYVLSALGGQPDLRERDREFATTGGLTKSEAWGRLAQTVAGAKAVIQQLPDEAWLTVRHVQAYRLTAVGILLHVVEHYSYHTGQIVYITKMLAPQQMDFYANVNLNEKNRM
jgi:uncharacterized damage-inducible protein DinB